METVNTFKSSTTTHPFLTMLLFGAMLGSLIGAGSYVSKQRSLARQIELESTPSISYAAPDR